MRRRPAAGLAWALLLAAPALAGCVAPGGPLAAPPPALVCLPPCARTLSTGEGGVHEPMLAVHPRDPLHIVAAANHVPVSAAYVTRDGGATWTRSAPLPPEMGSGPTDAAGDEAFMSDPTALILRDGTVLFAALAGRRAATPDAPGARTFVSTGPHLDVARSEDGGDSFASVARVAEGRGGVALARVQGLGFPLGAGAGYQDKEWMAEGPDGSVLIVWTEVDADAARLLWAVSRDQGRTWSAPRALAEPVEGQPHGSMPAIGRDGTWYVAYVIALALTPEPRDFSCCARMLLARSADGGATWHTTLLHASVPFQMTQLRLAEGPHGRERLWLAHTVRPDPGALDGWTGPAREQAVLAWSDDGGATWSAPLALREPGAHGGALVPALDVGPDGTAYVSLYNATSPDTMERRLVAVRDGRVAADLLLDEGLPGPAVLPHGLGDYMGLVALQDGAWSVWVNDADGARVLRGARVQWGGAP